MFLEQHPATRQHQFKNSPTFKICISKHLCSITSICFWTFEHSQRNLSGSGEPKTRLNIQSFLDNDASQQNGLTIIPSAIRVGGPIRVIVWGHAITVSPVQETPFLLHNVKLIFIIRVWLALQHMTVVTHCRDRENTTLKENGNIWSLQMLANHRRVDETLKIWKNAAGENDYKIEPDKIKERHSSSDETNCWSERDVERWSVLKGIIQLNTNSSGAVPVSFSEPMKQDKESLEIESINQNGLC